MSLIEEKIAKENTERKTQNVNAAVAYMLELEKFRMAGERCSRSNSIAFWERRKQQYLRHKNKVLPTSSVKAVKTTTYTP